MSMHKKIAFEELTQTLLLAIELTSPEFALVRLNISSVLERCRQSKFSLSGVQVTNCREFSKKGLERVSNPKGSFIVFINFQHSKL